MSFYSTPTQSWSIIKYVDLRTTDHRTLTGPHLVAQFYRHQHLLCILNGTSLIESVHLPQKIPSLIYRDTAVVFLLPLPNHYVKFRIRFERTADRMSFCMALQEFVKVEKVPSSRSQPSSQRSSFAQSFSMVGSRSQPCLQSCSESSRSICATPISSHSAFISSSENSRKLIHWTHNEDSFSLPSTAANDGSIEVHDAETQTEYSTISTGSPERLRNELCRLLKDPSFHQLVERVAQIAPMIDAVHNPYRS